MARHQRNLLPGGTFFFTATLAEQSSRVLVEHVEALRTAMRVTRRRRPFSIDAIVVLPNHLQLDACWTGNIRHSYVRLGLLPQDWGGDFRAERGDFGEPRH